MKRINVNVLKLVIIFLVCAFLELGLSLCKYWNEYTGTKETWQINESLTGDVTLETSGSVTLEQNNLSVGKAGGSLFIRGNFTEVHSFSFITKNANVSSSVYAKVSMLFSYYGSEETRQSVSTWEYGVTGKELRVDILLDRLREVSVIEVRFAASDADYTVSGMILNAAAGSPFHIGRFLLIYLFALLVFVCCHFRVWETVFDAANPVHERIYWSCMVACLLFVCFVYTMLLGNSVKADIAYPLERVSSQQCFVQQFDAFMKHQIHIDVEPSKELLALENPYDNSQRNGISYLWDRALYDGKYYSYFGVAPVLLVYFPYYFLFGVLPGAAKVMLFYTLVGTVSLFGLLHAWVRVFRMRVNLLLFSLGSTAVAFASGLFLMLRGWSSVYYLASLAGLASVLVFLWVSLRAYEAKNLKIQTVLFALSGLCLVITVASRTNHALMGILVIAPVYISFLREKRSRKEKICAVTAFFIPALLGAAAISWYNQARFDSIFEFGASYQLTVSDVRNNHIAFNRVFPALYHYWVQPARWTLDFPFVQFLHTRLSHYGYYIYIDTNMGILNYPLVVAAFGCIGLLGRKKRELRHVVYGVALAAAIGISIMNFSIGGVNYRYTYDICFMVAAVGAFVLMELYGLLSSDTGVRMKCFVFTVCAAIMLVTVFVAFMLIVNHYNGNFVGYSPVFWMKLRDMFVFW